MSWRYCVASVQAEQAILSAVLSTLAHRCAPLPSLFVVDVFGSSLPPPPVRNAHEKTNGMM